jgi:hypothetical protein
MGLRCLTVRVTDGQVRRHDQAWLGWVRAVVQEDHVKVALIKALDVDIDDEEYLSTFCDARAINS